jgi:anti-sigma-K factor RskA
MNAVGREAPERQEIEALLPWHAAGTLSRRDRERVERAIANDGELARRLTLVREEQQETIHLNESLGVPSSRAMEKLFAAIEAEGAPAPVRRSFDLVGRVSSLLSGFAPRTIAYAAAAATVAFFLQSAMLTAFLMKDHQDTSTPQLASANTPSNAHAVIRFSPQATASEIISFLNAHGAEVVEGPIRNGSFNIRFSADTPPSEVVRKVRRMQSETKVVEFIATKGDQGR